VPSLTDSATDPTVIKTINIFVALFITRILSNNVYNYDNCYSPLKVSIKLFLGHKPNRPYMINDRVRVCTYHTT